MPCAVLGEYTWNKNTYISQGCEQELCLLLKVPIVVRAHLGLEICTVVGETLFCGWVGGPSIPGISTSRVYSCLCCPHVASSFSENKFLYFYRQWSLHVKLFEVGALRSTDVK